MAGGPITPTSTGWPKSWGRLLDTLVLGSRGPRRQVVRLAELRVTDITVVAPVGQARPRGPGHTVGVATPVLHSTAVGWRWRRGSAESATISGVYGVSRHLGAITVLDAIYDPWPTPLARRGRIGRQAGDQRAADVAASGVRAGGAVHRVPAPAQAMTCALAALDACPSMLAARRWPWMGCAFATWQRRTNTMPCQGEVIAGLAGRGVPA